MKFDGYLNAEALPELLVMNYNEATILTLVLLFHAFLTFRMREPTDG